MYPWHRDTMPWTDTLLTVIYLPVKVDQKVPANSFALEHTMVSIIP